ncbi:MAG: prolyl oligopeptidase family serine peptidase [Acidobacteriota bacterium]
MIKKTHVALAAALVVLVVASAGPAAAQLETEAPDNSKRPLTHQDYDSWKRIQGEKISADGQWVLYAANPQEGDGELVVHHVVEGTEYRYPRGKDARFTTDASHVVFLIAPLEEDKKAARKEKKKPEEMPKAALGIMDLATGEVTTVERVKNFMLPEKAGGWVAYLKEGTASKRSAEGTEVEEKKAAGEPEKQKGGSESEEKKEFGTPLVLRSLTDGGEWSAKSVTEYRFTRHAEYLLYIVSSEEEPQTDGVYAYVPSTGVGSALLAGKGDYRRWAMDKNETRLAFVTDRDDQQADEPTFSLYGWKPGDAQATLWVSHSTTAGFPDGYAVSDKSDLAFNKGGEIVLFGIKERPQTRAAGDDDEADEEEKAVFDLWHWNDPYPQPQQLVMREEVENQTWESVYHIDSGSFVQLADEAVPDASLSRDGRVAFAQTNVPYTKLISYDGRYIDAYIIDTSTGQRVLAATKVFRRASLSPGGRFVIWFDDKDYDWYAYDIASGKTSNVTASLDVRLEREDHDTPNPAPPYGLAGWTDDDRSMVVNDRYDIWEVRPDGSGARMITEGYGRANGLSFRYLRLDPDATTIDPNAPMLLRATHEATMSSGFWRDRVNGSQPPSKLLMADKSFSTPVKAKEADLLLFTRSSFDEFPDLWVGDMDFAATKVSNLGAQMEPFIWGKAELRDFHSADGNPLKGIFMKPDNFDPAKRYPLLVYIYETLHQGLHRFRSPSPGTSINPSYYVSNGYLLWMPDIEYKTGYPGKDALKCVLPGINMLVEEGGIAPDRIGIQGHSWGGYQIAYMVTQTDIFAAAEAGAPVVNMTSAYDGIRWGSGRVRQFQYERTQSRLGASLWEVPLRYVENSPLFWADKISTPLLMLHNDGDTAVPWYQGIEMIMAMRRLGEEAYMLNYNGEPHGLRKRANQKDWTVRMAEFFDHFLKGDPAPAWMTEGIRAWEKGKTSK